MIATGPVNLDINKIHLNAAYNIGKLNSGRALHAILTKMQRGGDLHKCLTDRKMTMFPLKCR